VKHTSARTGPKHVVVNEIVINKKHFSCDWWHVYRNCSNLVQQDAPHKNRNHILFITQRHLSCLGHAATKWRYDESIYMHELKRTKIQISVINVDPGSLEY
jgi:hypothetical protein